MIIDIVGRNIKNQKNSFDEKWTPCPITGCWLWTAAAGVYGYFWCHPFGNIEAHRAAKFIYENISPEETKNGTKKHMDHICNVKLCVNPNHIQIITAKENIKKGYDLKKRIPQIKEQFDCYEEKGEHSILIDTSS